VNIENLAETNFHRGVRAAVTRDIGRRFQVFALAQDQCREGVPEGIRRKTPGEFGFLPGRKGYHQIPSAKNIWRRLRPGTAVFPAIYGRKSHTETGYWFP